MLFYELRFTLVFLYDAKLKIKKASSNNNFFFNKKKVMITIKHKAHISVEMYFT